MEDPPADYRFGSRQGAAIRDVPADVTFLSWGGAANAAAVLTDEVEGTLLEDEEAPGDRLDRALLAASLASQWLALRGEAGFLRHCWAIDAIRHDPGRRQLWDAAVARSSEGVRLHASHPARALELYTEALKLFEAAGDDKGAGRCRGNLGLLALQRQQFPAAIEQCTAALELHERVQYDRGCLMHLINLLAANMQLGRWDAAHELCGRRLLVARRIDPCATAAVRADLGWCAWQLGQRDRTQRAYEEAVGDLARVQTPAGLARQVEALGPLAHALGRAPELQARLPLLQQEIARGLQALDVAAPAPSGLILRRFQDAIERHDEEGIYASLAQSECWSALSFERVLAEYTVAALLDDRGGERRWAGVARRLALAFCRSFLDRGPYDEHALFQTWNTEQRVAKAKAYALKITALAQASSGNDTAARAALATAWDLHRLVGDRHAGGPWFPEAYQELDVPPAARGRMHALMVAAYRASAVGSRDDERALLMELLAVASEHGTALNRADAYVRLGIHHAQAGRRSDAATWFARAEQAFRQLERVGISIVEETGRAHGRLKLAHHLVAFLEQTGRDGEVPGVAVPAVREAGWFIEGFGHSEYAIRAMGYKSGMLYALTRAYERLGSYHKALTRAEELQAWSERIGDLSGIGAAQHAKAVALRALNQVPDALAAAEADLELQRGRGDRREIAVALVLCADLYLELDRVEEARAAAQQAIECAGGEAGAAQAARDARYVLARAAGREGDPAEASRLYMEILREEEAAPGQEWIATALALALAQLDCGRPEQALQTSQRAWSAAASVASLPLRAKAGYVWARCQLATGEGPAVRKAIDVLLDCCAQVERIRRETTDEWHRTSIAVAETAPFELLLSVLLSIVRIDPDPAWTRLAFEIGERAKARGLAESIALSAAREAESRGFRLAGLSVREIDAREEIASAGFDDVRAMLRQELAGGGGDRQPVGAR
jgi:tetratricopeptide (TPR) repeat protein